MNPRTKRSLDRTLFGAISSMIEKHMASPASTQARTVSASSGLGDDAE